MAVAEGLGYIVTDWNKNGLDLMHAFIVTSIKGLISLIISQGKGC
jgi:hypothetical protein